MEVVDEGKFLRYTGESLSAARRTMGRIAGGERFRELVRGRHTVSLLTNAFHQTQSAAEDHSVGSG